MRLTEADVEKAARELQGKYGGVRSTWSHTSEAVREEWRRDARDLLSCIFEGVLFAE
jgi:hypothetical protein